MRRGSETSKVLDAAVVPVLPASAGRRGLRLSPPGAGRVTLSVYSDVTIDKGLTLTAGMQPLYLCEDCVGDLLQRQWFGIADAAGRTIGIFESMEG